MDKYKTLIIYDWDDTLFCTSWITNNQVDLHNPLYKRRHIDFFKKLDRILFKLFIKMLRYKNTKLIIVTNATKQWITICCEVLPRTKNIIHKYVDVISARDVYQEKYPRNSYIWKKLIFRELAKEYFLNQTINKQIQNIISIGDAEYEFNALKNLDNQQTNIRLLKSIRMIQGPSYDQIIDQLNVINNNFYDLYIRNNHMDLFFSSK